MNSNRILQQLNAPKAKTPDLYSVWGSYYSIGDALLSHGETPHYHRHYGILLLSSEWSQVELPHYGRQNILLMIFCLSLFFVLLFLNSKQAVKTLERCIVKPLGQLVCVSSTARTAYTSHLSTS